MPYIYGDPAEAPIAAAYSENSLRLYPTENADGEYHILRLLRDGDNYYYEISDTNSRSFFSVDKTTWQMLDNGIDMYSPRIIRSYVTEELSDGKYLIFGENGNYTIYWDDKLAVGEDIIVVYIGNVYAVDIVIDVIPAETAEDDNTVIP